MFRFEQRNWRAAVAIITIACFSFSNISFAAQSFGIASPEVSFSGAFKFDQALALRVPGSIATVEKLQPGSGKTIFHIQTAHGHYQAEKQIEALLKNLEENYGVKTVLMEGASRPLNPEIINLFPKDRKMTMEALNIFARHSIVSGPEMYLLQSAQAKGFGIEDEDAYTKNLRDFAAVIRARDASQKFLNDLAAGVERLSAVYLSSEARSFLKQVERHVTGEVPFDAYLQQLKIAAQKYAEIDLADPSWQIMWPMLTRIFTIEKLEKKIDAAQFEQQKKDFLKAIKPYTAGGRRSEDRGNSVYQKMEQMLSLKDLSAKLPDPETSLLIENLVKALPENFNYARFSSVTSFCGMLMLKSEIKVDLLSTEIQKLEDTIADKLAETKQAKELVAILKDYRMLQKLFALELLPSDFDSLTGSVLDAQQRGRTPMVSKIQPSQIAARLQALETAPTDAVKGSQPRRLRGVEFKNTDKLNALFIHAIRFYEGARQRDGKMLVRIEERLQETGADKIAVITGGFHSEPFAKYFEKRGYNYALITPKITGTDPQGHQNYLDVMMMWNAIAKHSQGRRPEAGASRVGTEPTSAAKRLASIASQNSDSATLHERVLSSQPNDVAIAMESQAGTLFLSQGMVNAWLVQQAAPINVRVSGNQIVAGRLRAKTSNAIPVGNTLVESGFLNPRGADLGSSGVGVVRGDLSQAARGTDPVVTTRSEARYFIEGVTGKETKAELDQKIETSRDEIQRRLEEGIRGYLEAEVRAGRFSAFPAKVFDSTVASVRVWLHMPEIDRYTKLGLLKAIAQERWEDITQAHSSKVKFGTAGPRQVAALTYRELVELGKKGFHAEILKGPNTINNVTLALLTTGVARYFKKTKNNPRVSVTYDSRVYGKAFADYVAAIFLKEGVQVYLFDISSPMPEMSFSVAELKLDLGILISASHNPELFNGYKVSNAQGAQLDPATRKGVEENVYGNGGSISEVSFEDIAEVLSASAELEDPMAVYKEKTNVDELGPLVEKYSSGDPRQVVVLSDKDVERDSKGRERIDIHGRHLKHVLGLLIDREMTEKELKTMKTLYSAFYGNGTPVFQRIGQALGLKAPLIVKAFSVLDGLFPKFAQRFVGKVLAKIIPDPGNSAGQAFAWEEVVREFINQSGNSDEAMKLLAGLFVAIGTDPDADRLGVVVPIPEEEIPVGVIILPRLHPKKIPTDEVTVARISQLIAYLVPKKYREQVGFGALKLLSANDTWAVLLKYRIDRFVEMKTAGKIPANAKFTIIKTHVTTDALTALAAYGRSKGLDIEIIEPYVGFSLVAEEIQKGWEEGKINLGGAEESGGFSIGGAPPAIYAVLRYYQMEKKEPIDTDPNSYFGYRKEEIQEVEAFLLAEGALEGSTGGGYRLSRTYHSNIENLAQDAYWALFRPLIEKAPGSRLGKRGHTLEKDGLMAATLMLEVAAYAKSQGLTLNQYLRKMYLELGYFSTTNQSLEFKNTISGTQQKIGVIKNALELGRKFIAKQKIEMEGHLATNVQIFVPKAAKYADGKNFPKGDYVDLAVLLANGVTMEDITSFFPEEGIRFHFGKDRHLTIRPSGTENKLRFYVEWFVAPDELTEETLTQKILEADSMAYKIAEAAKVRVSSRSEMRAPGFSDFKYDGQSAEKLIPALDDLRKPEVTVAVPKGLDAEFNNALRESDAWEIAEYDTGEADTHYYTLRDTGYPFRDPSVFFDPEFAWRPVSFGDFMKYYFGDGNSRGWDRDSRHKRAVPLRIQYVGVPSEDTMPANLARLIPDARNGRKIIYSSAIVRSVRDYLTLHLNTAKKVMISIPIKLYGSATRDVLAKLQSNNRAQWTQLNIFLRLLGNKSTGLYIDPRILENESYFQNFVKWIAAEARMDRADLAVAEFGGFENETFHIYPAWWGAHMDTPTYNRMGRFAGKPVFRRAIDKLFNPRIDSPRRELAILLSDGRVDGINGLWLHPALTDDQLMQFAEAIAGDSFTSVRLGTGEIQLQAGDVALRLSPQNKHVLDVLPIGRSESRSTGKMPWYTKPLKLMGIAALSTGVYFGVQLVAPFLWRIQEAQMGRIDSARVNEIQTIAKALGITSEQAKQIHSELMLGFYEFVKSRHPRLNSDFPRTSRPRETLQGFLNDGPVMELFWADHPETYAVVRSITRSEARPTKAEILKKLRTIPQVFGGLHGSEQEDVVDNFTTLNAQGIRGELGSPEAVAAVRAKYPDAIIPATIHEKEQAPQIYGTVKAGADILVSDEPFIEGTIKGLNGNYPNLILIVFASSKEEIDAAIRLGVDGIKIKPTANTPEDTAKANTLIAYVRETLGNKDLLILGAGGIKANNLQSVMTALPGMNIYASGVDAKNTPDDLARAVQEGGFVRDLTDGGRALISHKGDEVVRLVRALALDSQLGRLKRGITISSNAGPFTHVSFTHESKPGKTLTFWIEKEAAGPYKISASVDLAIDTPPLATEKLAIGQMTEPNIAAAIAGLKSNPKIDKWVRLSRSEVRLGGSAKDTLAAMTHKISAPRLGESARKRLTAMTSEAVTSGLATSARGQLEASGVVAAGQKSKGTKTRRSEFRGAAVSAAAQAYFFTPSIDLPSLETIVNNFTAGIVRFARATIATLQKIGIAAKTAIKGIDYLTKIFPESAQEAEQGRVVLGSGLTAALFQGVTEPAQFATALKPVLRTRDDVMFALKRDPYAFLLELRSFARAREYASSKSAGVNIPQLIVIQTEKPAEVIAQAKRFFGVNKLTVGEQNELMALFRQQVNLANAKTVHALAAGNGVAFFSLTRGQPFKDALVSMVLGEKLQNKSLSLAAVLPVYLSRAAGMITSRGADRLTTSDMIVVRLLFGINGDQGLRFDGRTIVVSALQSIWLTIKTNAVIAWQA